jgi:hypothetical protein
MSTSVYRFIFIAILLAACGGQSANVEGEKDKEESKPGRVLRETIATGEKGYVTISSFRKEDISEDLCQQWELNKNDGASSPELIVDENNAKIFPQYNFFKDGSVVENPRHHIRVGKWRLAGRDSLILNFNDGSHRWFIITSVNARELRLVTKNEDGKALYLNMSVSGKVHENMLNDPFHPINNEWRIPPQGPEDDSAIKKRVTNCLKFFALYYRDVLLRDKSSINFEGLPHIFNWYRGGIGLPDREKVDDSWIECFYNKEAALKGYGFLRKLIVDYEYDWPEKVEWSLQTHSVLEQMYHKTLTVKM